MLPPPLPAERLLTIAEIADYARVSQHTMRRWIDKGQLNALRLGSRIRIRPEDFEAFLRQER